MKHLQAIASPPLEQEYDVEFGLQLRIAIL